MEDFEGLERLIGQLNESHVLLRSLGEKFVSVGMCEQAVSAFLKAGEPSRAVDTCVMLNEWSMAVQLATEHRIRNIEPLLNKYSDYLLEQKKLCEAIELFRKANYCAKSAKLLFQVSFL
jgi:WD repeat-containing protein 35